MRLQGAVGVLLPLALLWIWEERLRWRKLQQWQEQMASSGTRAVDHTRKPLRRRWVAVWWLGSCWLLWLLLEAVML